eukprot:jgi/Chrzof1/11126/Cz05g24210.t1
MAGPCLEIPSCSALDVRLPFEAICHMQAAASGDYWRVQRRHLQFLPEDAANVLMQELLQQSAISAPQLDLFKYSLTVLKLDCKVLTITVGADWLAYLSTFKQLQVLHIHHSRINSKHIACLASLHHSLIDISFKGCRGIDNRSLSTIAQLTALQALCLEDTGVKPTVLAALTGLSQLTSLRVMGSAAITDDEARSLPAFSQLCELSLSEAPITNTGVMSILQLPRLQFLDLSWTEVASLPVISSLQVLHMQACMLTGGVLMLDDAAACTNLVELDLSFCHAEVVSCECLADMIRCSSARLKKLDLYEAAFQSHDTIVKALGTATALESLQLPHDAVPGSHMPILGQLLNLTNLQLDAPSFSPADLAWLWQLHKLTRLSLLDSLHFDDHVLPVIWQLTGLVHLELHQNELSGVVPDAAGMLATMGLHQPMSVPQANLSWAGMKSLTHLNLMDTVYTDAGCQELATALAGRLRCLKLGSGRVTNRGWASIAKMTALEELWLKDLEMTDFGISSLSDLTRLTALHFHGMDGLLLSRAGVAAFVAGSCPSVQQATWDNVSLLADREQAVGDGSSTAAIHSSTPNSSQATKLKSAVAAAQGSSQPLNNCGERGGMSLYKRLVAYDERWKYTAQELQAVQASPFVNENIQAIQQCIPSELNAE